MASPRLIITLLLFVLVHVFVLLSPPVHCNEDEDNLLQGINSFRQAAIQPPLVKNGKADCLADEIANELEDESCTSTTNGASIVPSSNTRLSDFPKHLDKCKINANSTADAIIMSVCVPDLVPTLVLTNYTHTPLAKYLNNSKYTGVGVGSEDNWMVVVLTTNTTTGSFSGALSLVPKVGFGHYMVSSFLGLFFLFAN